MSKKKNPGQDMVYVGGISILCGIAMLLMPSTDTEADTAWFTSEAPIAERIGHYGLPWFLLAVGVFFIVMAIRKGWKWEDF